MTSIVGIYCNDGVVIGTDSSATFVTGLPAHLGYIPTIEQETKKIYIINNEIIVACSGHVGLAQRFCEVITTSLSNKVFDKPYIEIGTQLSGRMIHNMQQSFTQPGSFGALVAFPSDNHHRLCEFQSLDFQPEFKDKRLWYCSMGSAQAITDTFLGFIRKYLWEKGYPNKYDAAFAVLWTLQLAVRINAGGVNGPIKIAVLERTQRGKLVSRIYKEDELQEHYQSIDSAERSLRNYKAKLHDVEADDIPDIPKP